MSQARLQITAHSIQDHSTFQGIRVLTDSQSPVRRLASGPAHQSDSICSTIWTRLSAASIQNTVNVQWIPAHVGKGNDLADSDAKHGSTLLSQRLAWIISRHLQHSLPTNTPSLPQGMTVIHTRVFTEYLPTWSILTVAGRATGPETSASQWLSCTRAILDCCWRICTASDVETLPLVYIAMVLTRQQNIWCYTAQHTTRRSGSHGQISTIKATQDAYGASWRGSGW